LLQAIVVSRRRGAWPTSAAPFETSPAGRADITNLRIRMSVSPQLFSSYWYGQALRELAQAQGLDATSAQCAALPVIRERIRLHERLLARHLASEQNLVAVLEQIIRGEGATCDTVNLGAINNEARELLVKWQDPDRDALHPYS
jgi:hypothetical protein